MHQKDHVAVKKKCKATTPPLEENIEDDLIYEDHVLSSNTSDDGYCPTWYTNYWNRIWASGLGINQSWSFYISWCYRGVTEKNPLQICVLCAKCRWWRWWYYCARIKKIRRSWHSIYVERKLYFYNLCWYCISYITISKNWNGRKKNAVHISRICGRQWQTMRHFK